jgi:hypothetical protein
VLVGLVEAGDVPMRRGFRRWLAVVERSTSLSNDPPPLPWLLTRCCGCSSTAVTNPWPGRLTRRWQVLGGGCQRTRWVEWAGATYLRPPWSVRHGRPSTLPLFSSWLLWLLGPIYAFAVFVEPGDVAVMVVESERAGGLSSNGGLRRL